MTETIRAADYTRVSTTGQKDDGYSLLTQAERNARFIAEQSWQLLFHEEDDESGMTLDRPGLDRIRELVRARQIDALVVYELDRLSRKFAHQIILREECLKAGVQLWYAKSGSRSGQSAEELLGENVLGLLGEIEHEKIRERTTRNRRKKAQLGK